MQGQMRLCRRYGLEILRVGRGLFRDRERSEDWQIHDGGIKMRIPSIMPCIMKLLLEGMLLAILQHIQLAEWV
jgi:hypothetical protein